MIFIGLKKNYMEILQQLVNLKRQLSNKCMSHCQMISLAAMVWLVKVVMYFPRDYPTGRLPWSFSLTGTFHNVKGSRHKNIDFGF